MEGVQSGEVLLGLSEARAGQIEGRETFGLTAWKDNLRFSFHGPSFPFMVGSRFGAHETHTFADFFIFFPEEHFPLYSFSMSKEIYRQAASIVLLRRAHVCSSEECLEIVELLLLHKPRKRDDWQLPQGGVENGETMEKAALRELKEEAGISQVKVVGKSREAYQYDFPQSYRHFRPDNVCGQRIAFLFAEAPADARVVVDQKEVDGYVWVPPEHLSRYIRRQAYRDLVQRLVQEAARCLR